MAIEGAQDALASDKAGFRGKPSNLARRAAEKRRASMSIAPTLRVGFVRIPGYSLIGAAAGLRFPPLEIFAQLELQPVAPRILAPAMPASVLVLFVRHCSNNSLNAAASSATGEPEPPVIAAGLAARA